MLEDEDRTSAPIQLNSQQVTPDVMVIRIGGDIDSETVPDVTAYLARAVDTGPAHLVLDLGSVTFLSSAGLSLLLRAREMAGSNNGVLHVIGVLDNRCVERPLTLMGMMELFDIGADLDGVLDSLAAL